jgi:hypothetical protein
MLATRMFATSMKPGVSSIELGSVILSAAVFQAERRISVSSTLSGTHRGGYGQETAPPQPEHKKAVCHPERSRSSGGAKDLSLIDFVRNTPRWLWPGNSAAAAGA